MGKLDKKVALITGGSSGIGLATARRFLAEGAQVYVTGRRQAKVDEAVARLGSGAIGVAGDVASAEDRERLFEHIRRDKGRLDVVFANAAALEFVPLERIDEAHVERLFGANVRGVIFTVQGALPLMPDGGSIVLCGSIGAVRGFPAQTVYAATKAAVRSLARTWTSELKERKIRVNVVSPGVTATEGAYELFGGEAAAKEHHAMVTPMVPAGRVADPNEIARVVVFLASEDASYVQGVELFADGGFGQV